jgi:ribosomal protein S18 acetylase RimI-like enzyme
MWRREEMAQEMHKVGNDIPLVIRDMRGSDYDHVVDLWRLSGLKYSGNGRDSREAVLTQLARPSSIFFVAERDGRIVAAALCTHDGRKGWINRLAVLPQCQKMGVGGTMVQEAERRFRELGLEVYSCLIMADNERSQQMFAHLGYVRQDDVVYYSKRTRDDA